MIVAGLRPGRPIRRLLQMTATWTASDVLRGAMRLAASAVVARRLGVATFGRLALALTWASALIAAFDLGLRALLTRDAAQRTSPIGPAVADAMALRLACFLPIGLLLWGAPYWLPGVSPVTLVRAVGVLALSGLMYGCVAAVHHATPARLAGILAVETAGTAIECGAGIAIVLAHGQDVSLVYLAAGVQIAQFVAATVMWRLVAPEDPPHVPTWSGARRLLGRALPFAAAGLVGNAQARIAPLMLGALAGSIDVAAFGAASRLEGTARRLPSAALGAALPVFAAKDGSDTVSRRRFDLVVLLFGIGASVVLFAGAAPIVHAVYGAAFGGAVWPLRWGAAGLTPYLLNGASKVQLYADGRERTAVRWSAVALAIQGAGCLLMIPLWGAAGASAALVAGELAVCGPLRAALRLRAQQGRRLTAVLVRA